MQTYLLPHALKDPQLQPQLAALAEASADGSLQGSMFSSRLQCLLHRACTQAQPSPASRNALKLSGSQDGLGTMSGGTVRTNTASDDGASGTAAAASVGRAGSCLAFGMDDWVPPVAGDPLFLKVFDTCRTVAAAHLGPARHQDRPVFASRSNRRSSLPLGLLPRHTLVPDSPHRPAAAAALAALQREGSAADMPMGPPLAGLVTSTTTTSSVNTGSYQRTRTGPANHITGHHAAGVERTPSAMTHSGSLWNALLTTNISQTLPQLEMGNNNTGLTGDNDAVGCTE